MFSPGRKSFSRTMRPAKMLKGSLPALSGLPILTNKNKKRGNTLNFNPNGASDVAVDLENNRPPANMLERLPVSSYDGDLVLVPADRLDEACEVLQTAGRQVRGDRDAGSGRRTAS